MEMESGGVLARPHWGGSSMRKTPDGVKAGSRSRGVMPTALEGDIRGRGHRTQPASATTSAPGR